MTLVRPMGPLRPRRGGLAGLAFAIVLFSLPAAAGQPNPNFVLQRTFIDVTPGADFQNGNYEHRRDRFTNGSMQPLVLAGVEAMMLNPEELGFDDIEPDNARLVQATARAAFSEYRFWGTSFWHNSSSTPPLDVPPVNWVFAEFPAPTFPIELAPGESFVLETVAHNNLFGPVNPPPERIGELVIGWRFLTRECGNGTLEEDEECDDGNEVDGDGCRNDCTLPVCGDGIVDSINEEACDDGNGIDADACRNDCTIPVCGDFIVDAQNAETCDPPGEPSGIHMLDCRIDCTVCGDGVIDSGEDCDDGNIDDGDACRNDCTAPVCGDGIVDRFTAEACDDGNGVDDDGCRNDCTIPVCGDGIVDGINEEACDDGNGVDDDGCRNDCTIPVCGDFIVDAQNAETCDPPGEPSGIHMLDCRVDCTVCGDGVTDSGEDCDDGNTDDADGCRNDCTAPICGDESVDPGEECDDGNGVDDDGCRNDCTIPVCGDGIVDGINEEDCDDGNGVDDDGCRNDCTIPVCGDGIVDTFTSEECDDGNGFDDDGCRNDCTIPVCGDGIVDSFNKEECDDGNGDDADSCRNDCTIPVCGDFIVDPQNAETCDPPGEPSGAIGNDCRVDCTVCGDGVVDAMEECDDGNALDTDLCRNDCTEPGIITRNADGARSLALEDVDGDGDLDVVSGSENDNKVAWYENTDTIGGDGIGDAEVWVEHLVSDQAMGVRSVTSGFLGYSPSQISKAGRHVEADVDRPEGRQSIAGKYATASLFSASFQDDSITSYENTYGDGLMWVPRTISSAVNGASSVFVADLSSDFCADVLATSATDGLVLWFRDEMCDGLIWSPPQVIDSSLTGARSAVATWLNFDSEFDVLAVGFDANSVVAYLNDGAGMSWSPVVISNTAFGATAVYDGDFDADGDIDAVVASSGGDSITWYENVNVGKGGDGTSWLPHVVTSSANGASAVVAYDLDFDYDDDIIAAASNDGSIVWYENAAGDGSVWIPHTVSSALPGASAVVVHDLNGDFQPDVVGASFDDDTVAWFENQSGLFPGSCGDGELNAYETCDPPGASAGGNGNLCRADCTVCGDSIVDPGEDCDDGNGVDAGDQCSNSCTSFPQAAGRVRSRKTQ